MQASTTMRGTPTMTNPKSLPVWMMMSRCCLLSVKGIGQSRQSQLIKNVCLNWFNATTNPKTQTSSSHRWGCKETPCPKTNKDSSSRKVIIIGSCRHIKVLKIFYNKTKISKVDSTLKHWMCPLWDAIDLIIGRVVSSQVSIAMAPKFNFSCLR